VTVLRQLHISGLGVIEDLDLELDPGLNVLTGETGAGKTMVTVGLSLALGRRASLSLVRTGAKAARVEARFEDVRPAEGWAEDEELVLARSVSADGRSDARIGAQLAPVSALAGLGAGLVEVHGQHEGISLRSPAAQTAFLDRFAGERHLEHVAALADAHARAETLRAAIEGTRERSRDRERELDLLAYQVREIEATAPRPGELAELEAEASRLAHAERLLDHAASAERTIGGDDGAGDSLSGAAASLRSVADLDPRAARLAEIAGSLAASAADLTRDVRAYREGVEVDPARLEAVGERIAALGSLRRRYGETEEEMLAFLEEARERLAGLEGLDESASRLAEELVGAEEQLRELAGEVTAARAAAAPRLAAAVEAELRELGMPEATIEVALEPVGDVSVQGAERAGFRFSAGAGQAPRPLAKVASGGELSRAMLACRSVLADLDDVPTLVFDEVDAGIGGAAGVAVGRRLAALASGRQVLVVTHLPQIASFADRHVRVEKRDGVAAVEVLDDAGRVEELTRMLSGLPRSEASTTHAQELLAEAGKAKARR
jgi:DNA repair protein RecN (Recombination protein N)